VVASVRPPADQPQQTANTGPPGSPWRRIVEQREPVLLLAAMMLVYFAVFGTLTWRQHANFGTLGYDMASATRRSGCCHDSRRRS
jgi:hypothetical protein